MAHVSFAATVAICRVNKGDALVDGMVNDTPPIDLWDQLQAVE